MKINETKMKKAQEEALEILQNSEDKSQAIIAAMEKLLNVQYEDLINELQDEATRTKSTEDYSKLLGFRALSKEEENFYTKIKEVNSALPGEQIDLIPTSVIDVTLESIKKESGILEDVEFAPADVKRWLVSEKSGTYSWGELADELKGALTGTIHGLSIEVSKLTAYMVIPKAVSDLGLPYIDKFFRKLLQEQLTDGLEFGYLQGTGKNMPIGIYKKIETTNQDGTHADKDVHNDLKSFSPKALAPAKKYLANGTRALSKLVIYCHPNDEADYVAPAIYDREGRLVSSYKNLVVKTSANNPEGKAALAIPKKYIMGLNQLNLKKYDQTLAMDDADLLVGKIYANGRATDDNIAYVFDVTKLEEYIPAVKTVEEVAGA